MEVTLGDVEQIVSMYPVKIPNPPSKLEDLFSEYDEQTQKRLSGPDREPLTKLEHRKGILETRRWALKNQETEISCCVPAMLDRALEESKSIRDYVGGYHQAIKENLKLTIKHFPSSWLDKNKVTYFIGDYSSKDEKNRERAGDHMIPLGEPPQEETLIDPMRRGVYAQRRVITSLIDICLTFNAPHLINNNSGFIDRFNAEPLTKGSLFLTAIKIEPTFLQTKVGGYTLSRSRLLDRGGSELLSIALKRNSLAHGSIDRGIVLRRILTILEIHLPNFRTVGIRPLLDLLANERYCPLDMDEDAFKKVLYRLDERLVKTDL